MTIPDLTAGDTVDEAWFDAVAEQLNALPRKIEHGRTAITTDGSGQATINFASTFGAIPSMPLPAMMGTSTYMVYLTSVTTTGFTVTVEATTTGAALASTAVTIGWAAFGIPA